MRLPLVTLCSTLLFASACGDDDDDEAPAVFNEAEIGPGGGVLTSGDGTATLNVPPGAVDADVGFFVDASTDPPPRGVMGSVYLFGPETTFLEPGHVSFAFAPDSIPAGGEHALRVASSENGGVDWYCIVAVAAEAGAGAAWASTTHLSDWALVLATCDGASDCTAPEQCLDPDDAGNRYCGIPCIDDGHCPSPMTCDPGPHVCRFRHCIDGAGCEGESVCSADVGTGICDQGPTDCAESLEQFGYTEAGKCVLQNKCLVASPDDLTTPCDDLGLAGKTCYHGWCVEPTLGCTCGDAGCPCSP